MTAPETQTAENSPQPGSKENKSRSRRVRRMGRAAVATTIMTGAAASMASIYAGKLYSDDPMLGIRHAAHSMGFGADKGPAPVPDSIQKEINRLIDSPTDPEYVRAAAKGDTYMRQYVGLEAPINSDADGDGFPGETPDDLTPEQLEHVDELLEKGEQARFEFAQKKAEELGLHLVDSQPFAVRAKEATSVDEVMSIMSEYTTQLGFPTKKPNSTDIRDMGIGINTLDSKDIDLNPFKRKAVYLMGSFSYIPREVYEYADLRELRIVKSIGEVDNKVVGEFSPAGIENSVSGVIYLDYSSMMQSKFALPMHEISHRIDYRMNGNSEIAARRDQEYGALNEPNFAYGDKSSDTENNVAAIYGATNKPEDKGGMMQRMINGLDTSLLYSDKPVLRNKYRLLVKRLEQHIPGYGKYLLATSSHTK